MLSAVARGRPLVDSSDLDRPSRRAGTGWPRACRVMKDPRLADMIDPKAMPFNAKRMIYGGFKVIVDV
jgi:uncharacterized protein YbaA (DUF1428 family)